MLVVVAFVAGEDGSFEGLTEASFAAVVAQEVGCIVAEVLRPQHAAEAEALGFASFAAEAAVGCIVAEEDGSFAVASFAAGEGLEDGSFVAAVAEAALEGLVADAGLREVLLEEPHLVHQS